MKEFIKIFEKLYLWQITIIVSLFLIVLGFTGDIPYIDVELRAGRSVMAINAGIVFFLLGINLKLMMMMIEKKDGKNGKNGEHK
jgi:hypothetical protein